MDIRALTPAEVLDVGRGRRSLREILRIPLGLLAHGAALGRNALLAGDLVTAEACAAGIVAADSSFAYGHSLLASVRLMQGRPEEARLAAQAALRRAGNDQVLRTAALTLLARIGPLAMTSLNPQDTQENRPC
jgi:hypothetical protein